MYIDFLSELQQYFEKKLKKEISLNEIRLILIMIVQRIQLIKNIITIVHPYCEKNGELALKSFLIYTQDIGLYYKMGIDFKKDFDKKEIINEILEYIKKSDLFKDSIKLTPIKEEESDEKNLALVKSDLLSRYEKKLIFKDAKTIKEIIEKIEKNEYPNNFEKNIYNMVFEKNDINNDISILMSIKKINQTWERINNGDKFELFNILKKYY